MIRVYYENREFANQIEYVFKVIGNCCGNAVKFVTNISEFDEKQNEQTLNITYGKNLFYVRNGMHIFEAQLFKKDTYLTTESIPQYPLYRYGNLPILFIASSQNADVEVERQQIKLKLDIVQSVFYILTNYEEAIQKEALFYDQHKRFKAQNRILYRENYYDRPLVNEYAKLICELSKQIGIEGMWNIPEKMSFHITHDVDYPYEITFGDRVQIQLFNRILGLPIKRKISRGSEIIDTVERENGIISSWYFKGGGASKFDDKYQLRNKKNLQFVSSLKRRGCEIGYHYSYDASVNESLAQQEYSNVKETLHLDYVCGRNHFLRYEIPISWRIYEKIGIYYDTTQGCAECEGFLRGICIPYKLFDLQEGRELDVWEIPLVVMDGTLRGEAYGHYDAEEALKRILELMQTAKEFSGVFSMLWHNTSITGNYWGKWFEVVYEPAMKYIGSFDKCSMKGSDIIQKYNINN